MATAAATVLVTRSRRRPTAWDRRPRKKREAMEARPRTVSSRPTVPAASPCSVPMAGR